MNLKTNPSMTIHKIVLKDRNVMVAKGVMHAMRKNLHIHVEVKIEPHPNLHSFLFVLIYVAVISNIG